MSFSSAHFHSVHNWLIQFISSPVHILTVQVCYCSVQFCWSVLFFQFIPVQFSSGSSSVQFWRSSVQFKSFSSKLIKSVQIILFATDSAQFSSKLIRSVWNQFQSNSAQIQFSFIVPVQLCIGLTFRLNISAFQFNSALISCFHFLTSQVTTENYFQFISKTEFNSIQLSFDQFNQLLIKSSIHFKLKLRLV